MAVQTILFANLANTSLAGAITNTSTTMTVQAGTGALFPSPGANQYFILLVKDQATGLTYEIMHVTNVTVDTFTIVRAQEGTTAVNWSAGDLCANLWTAGSAQGMLQTALGNPGRLLGRQVIGTPGSGNVTVPTDPSSTTITAFVRGWGGGCGSVASVAGSPGTPSAGGGSGGYFEGYITGFTQGANVPYQVGAGGGTTFGTAQAGGRTSFGTGPLVYAEGGFNNPLNTGGTSIVLGNIGGSASGGDLPVPGGQGTNAVGNTGGFGSGSPGGGGSRTNAGGVAGVGNFPGGGASGAGTGSGGTSSLAGAVGGAGCLIIEWYSSNN